jgi:poly-gamma-glutamate capsule biosynthesis protein CapA/YwtB (metallophosphatase superfamily)
MESWRHYREADWGATDERAGVFLMSKKDIPRALQTARNDADAVVAFAHWGSNYRPVSKAQRRIAGRLINGGADLVIGHHGHMAQQFGMYKGKPTVWGLGNFLFGTPGRFGHDKMQPGYGLLVRLVVKDQTLNRLELIPIMLNNRLTEFQPRLCTVSESEEVLRSLITKGDDNITVRDGVAIFPL